MLQELLVPVHLFFSGLKGKTNSGIKPIPLLFLCLGSTDGRQPHTDAWLDVKDHNVTGSLKGTSNLGYFKYLRQFISHLFYAKSKMGITN
jgi:hypothetical protein